MVNENPFILLRKVLFGLEYWDSGVILCEGNSEFLLLGGLCLCGLLLFLDAGLGVLEDLDGGVQCFAEGGEEEGLECLLEPGLGLVLETLPLAVLCLLFHNCKYY